MLDLNRLYWSCGVFPGGTRKGRDPYQHVGQKRPSADLANVLQDETSTDFAEAKAKAKTKTLTT